MKKLFAIILLLIITGGLAFYFSLIEVAPGKIAYLSSTLNGLSPKALTSGSFPWRWERLIPDTTRLFVYPLGSHMFQHKLKLILPPGIVKTLPESLQPRAEIIIDLTLEFDKENTLSLARKGVASAQALFEQLVPGVESRISSALSRETDIAIKENRTPELRGSLQTTTEEEIAPYLENTLSEYNLAPKSLSVRAITLPDAEQYAKLRQLLADTYPDLINQIRARLDREQRKQDREQKRSLMVARLEAMGKLLKDYPALIQYLAINKLSDKIQVMVLPAGGNSNLAGLKAFQQLTDQLLDGLKLLETKKAKSGGDEGPDNSGARQKAQENQEGQQQKQEATDRGNTAQ